MRSEEKITSKDFRGLFGLNDPRKARNFLKNFDRLNTAYHKAGPEEFREYLFFVLKSINKPYIARSRRENLAAFEKGWKENLDLLESGRPPALALKPKYFRPCKFLRYKGKLIVSPNRGLEYDLFAMARNLLFKNYLAPFRTIYELGCGSCQNLLMLSDIFPEKELWGLDWTSSSVKIARFLAGNLNKNIKGRIFDMARPGSAAGFKPASAFITVHSLEQMGSDFKKLVSFLVKARPGLVLHYEPIAEFYKEENCLDQLALIYTRKRNYLSGFYPYLLEQEKKGRIKIIAARRPFLGGVIHEASLIIWKTV